jgi:hypothetical protein
LTGIEADPALGSVVNPALTTALEYLVSRWRQWEEPRLWVGKGLYTPHAVVRAAILGALARMWDRRANGN